MKKDELDIFNQLRPLFFVLVLSKKYENELKKKLLKSDRDIEEKESRYDEYEEKLRLPIQ